MMRSDLQLGPVIRWLETQPFILLFLVVAAGYALGRIKLNGISLGATASSLLIALGLGLLGIAVGARISIPDLASNIFFNLFMFAVGLKVGPQLLSGLRRDAGKLIFFGLAIPFASAGLTLAMRALVHLPPGLLPGILAGSNTATPGLGAAQAAYATMHGPQHAATVANLSTAFAFSYCGSLILFVMFMKLPDLLGRNTSRAARVFEAQLRGTLLEPPPGTGGEFLGTPLPLAHRSYRLETSAPVGNQLGELRETYPLVSIERILRGGRVLVPTDDLVLQPHDTLALYGPISRLLLAASVIGPEVDVPELRDTSSQTADVVAHHDGALGQTLRALAENAGHGLYLNAMSRGGAEIPHGPESVIARGDVLRVTGAKWRIDALEAHVGRVVRPGVGTDLVTLALGLAAGGALGAVTIPVGALRLTIGSAVGLLLVGIVLGLLRTRNPALGGPFPEPARQLLEDLGLNVFVAVLGLNAGAGVVQTLAAGALGQILIGALVVGFIPPIVAWVIGATVFKMNDALLLGAVAGGRCCGPGLRVAQEVSDSTVPAISHPLTFALSNIVLTIGSYLVAMIG
jgi:putative transport protein